MRAAARGARARALSAAPLGSVLYGSDFCTVPVPALYCSEHETHCWSFLCWNVSEPTQWPHACDRLRAPHRAPPACPPSYAGYILADTTRHQTREPRDHAAPSDRRITTRRRLAGGVRRAGGQRLSVRGAKFASVRGAISARVPPSSPSRATRDNTTAPPLHSAHAQHPRAHITMHAPRR